MAWQQSPPELVALFDAVLPGPPVQRRLMFGYPSGFVNGRLAFGLFEDKLVLRLPPFALDALMRTGGLPFTPMPGRTMKGFAVMPPRLLVDGPGLRGWIQTAVEHAKTLPPKGGEPEAEGDLPVAAATSAKPAAKAKPKAKPKPKAAAKAKPKRAAAAKKPAKKPARKVVKKAAKKPARKAAKKPAKKAAKKGKPSAARKGGKAKRAAAKKRPAAKRKAAKKVAKRR